MCVMFYRNTWYIWRYNIILSSRPICDFGFEYLVAQNMISNMVLKDKYENKHLYAGFVYIFIFLMKQLVSVVLERAAHNNVNKN